MFCKTCGCDLGERPVDLVCPKCGATIQEKPEDEKTVKPAGKNQRASLSLKKKIVIGAAILAGLVVWAHDTRVSRFLEKQERVVVLEKDFENVQGYPEEQLQVVRKYGLYGVVDFDANEILPCRYDYISIEEGLISADIDYRRTAKLLTDDESYQKYIKEWKKARNYNMRDRIRFDSGEYDAQYLYNSDGKEINNSEKTSFHLAKANQKMNRIALCSVQDASDFKDYKIIDYQGNEINRVEQVTGIGEFSSNRLVLEKDDLCSLIDENGNEILPFEYDRIDDFQNGKSIVRTERGRIYLIDENGNRILDFGRETSYGWIIDLIGNGAYITVSETGSSEENPYQWGVISAESPYGIVLPGQYARGIEWSGNGFIAETADGFGVYDIHGRLLIPHQFDEIVSIQDGSCYVGKAERGDDENGYQSDWTIFDASGTVMGEYEDVSSGEQYNDFFIFSIYTADHFEKILVNNQGEVLIRDENLLSYEENGSYVIWDYDKNTSIVGNIWSDLSRMEMEGYAQLISDGLGLTLGNGDETEVYRYSFGQYEKIFSLNHTRIWESRFGTAGKMCLEISFDPWLPFVKDTYYIEVLK